MRFPDNVRWYALGQGELNQLDYDPASIDVCRRRSCKVLTMATSKRMDAQATAWRLPDLLDASRTVTFAIKRCSSGGGIADCENLQLI